MFWSFSYQLTPDETIIEDSKDKPRSAFRPLYSVLLTNKRAIFRFDSLGSSLSQTFYYQEIEDARPRRRFFISYVEIKARNKTYLINAPDADYWAGKIMGMKEQNAPVRKDMPDPGRGKKRALLHMLSALKDSSVLTEEEYEKKIKQIETAQT